MRAPFRGRSWRGALAAIAVALGACQQEARGPEEAPTQPTNAQREAEIAAEQLAALGAAASPTQRALYEGEFQASGGNAAFGAGEGAWELRLLEEYAQFSRPGLGEDGGVPGPRDYRERGVRVVAGALTITIMQQECEIADGSALPYTASVLYEGIAYQGCARRGIDESARPTWASVLPELIPAIDACLARAGSPSARITFATALDDSDVSVRLRESDGSRRECVASAAGAAVHVYEPISDLDRRSGEGDPEFQRAGGEPRAQACRTVEPAIGRDGVALGWLIRRSC